MRKVISINLNGQAYHLEETGYEALRAYLDAAASQLRNNPDRAEIVADLEQAIAEKCAACLAPNKNVVSAPEVDRIIAEMGPVRDPDAESASARVPLWIPAAAARAPGHVQRAGVASGHRPLADTFRFSFVRQTPTPLDCEGRRAQNRARVCLSLRTPRKKTVFR